MRGANQMTKRVPSPESSAYRGDPPSRPPLPADLMRVLDWLRRNPDCEVRLEPLSIVAGVRPRTLETHFKQFLGVTPLGWVRNFTTCQGATCTAQRKSRYNRHEGCARQWLQPARPVRQHVSSTIWRAAVEDFGS